MKYLYRGIIYEEDYHRGPTSHFNLEFIAKIHDLAARIGLSLFSYIRGKGYEPNKILQVAKSPNIYLQVTDETQYSEANAETSNYEDGYLIKIPERFAMGNDVGNDIFINLLHEVTHVLQRENGEYSDVAHNHKNGLNFNAYFNDPTEIKAFLMSIISYITFSPKRVNEVKNESFDAFYKQSLLLLDPGQSNFTDYMAHGENGDNTQDSTQSKFYEVLYLLYSKIRQGYFSSLPSLSK